MDCKSHDLPELSQTNAHASVLDDSWLFDYPDFNIKSTHKKALCWVMCFGAVEQPAIHCLPFKWEMNRRLEA